MGPNGTAGHLSEEARWYLAHRQVRDMTEIARGEPGSQEMPIPQDLVSSLVAKAARAPSVHNTQPWRFEAGRQGLELRADHGRELPQIDPAGRETLVSCGAALFGLRLAIRELRYRPAVRLLPDPADPSLLARVRLGAPAPMTGDERQLLTAMPHRHTHRGAFSPEPISAGLLAALQHDAMAEDATLVLIDRPASYQQLAALVSAADQEQRENAAVRAEVRRWTRPAGSLARDGVPAHAFPRRRGHLTGRLAQRDFDLDRGLGLLDSGGAPPATTAILITATDSAADWLHAGQALHRLLLRAASRWVFASLHSQPLEVPAIRAEIQTCLALPGVPQMLLQLGHSHTAAATARRRPGELLS